MSAEPTQREVFSILTGKPMLVSEEEHARLIAPRSQEPASPAAPALMEELGAVRAAVEYLRLEPAERARREAEPLIATALAEAEKEHQAALDALKALPPPPAPQAPSEVEERLRTLLADSENASATAQADLVVQRELHSHVVGQLAAVRAELAAERSKPQPAPSLHWRELSRPETVELDVERAEDGLLREVVLRAAGYNPVRVEIERGGDRRMRALKLRR